MLPSIATMKPLMRENNIDDYDITPR